MGLRPLHVVNRAVPEQAGYTLRTHQLVTAQASIGFRPTCIVHPSKRIIAHDQLERPGIGVRIEDGIRYCRLTEPRPLRRVAVHAAQWLRKNKVRGSWRLQNLALKLPADKWEPFISWAVRRNEFDIVHAHTPSWCAVAGRRLADALHCPLVYEVRGFWELTAEVEAPSSSSNGDEAKSWQEQEFAAASSADAVITLGETMREELVRRGLPRDRIHVIANGVDVKTFAPADKKDERLVSELAVGRSFVIGYATSVRALEGISTVLQALSKLGKCQRDVTFVLLGDGSDLDRLKAEAEELGVSQRVRFLGRVHHRDVPRYYSAFDAFVVPRVDASVCRIVTPLKPLEAMAAGLPLVVSDLPALTEVLDDGRAGISFRAEDPDDLAAKISYLIDNEAQRKEMGRSGRRWVCGARQWTGLAAQSGQLYTSLIEDFGTVARAES